MITPIRQVPLSPERLPDESARACQAFCVYRDLGPSRSFDRAWRQFCTDQGKDPGSARRPGHWAHWSRKFNWVQRAEAHDDLIDEERRSADAARRQELQDLRSRFAREEQSRKQDLVRNMDSVIDRALSASPAEVTQLKTDEAGTKTTTKLKPYNLRDTAVFIKERNKTANQAIEGIDIKDRAKEDREIERVVWSQHKKRTFDIESVPESGRGNGQPIAGLDSHPAASGPAEAALDEDKAA